MPGDARPCLVSAHTRKQPQQEETCPEQTGSKHVQRCSSVSHWGNAHQIHSETLRHPHWDGQNGKDTRGQCWRGGGGTAVPTLLVGRVHTARPLLKRLDG